LSDAGKNLLKTWLDFYLILRIFQVYQKIRFLNYY